MNRELLQKAKDEVAKKHFESLYTWNDLWMRFKSKGNVEEMEDLFDEVAELYATKYSREEKELLGDTEHPKLTGMILNAYDKVLNDMKSEREDNELDEQGNNK